MDKRAIGVFDSGLGGLTAVRRLHALMPQENIIYFGDTGRVPYGTRGRDIITKYARQDVAFLRQYDLKSIIIACNTVSAIALDLLSEENDIPIIGTVEPACRRAMTMTQTGRVGVIGTAATIRSGAYEKYLHKKDGTLEDYNVQKVVAAVTKSANRALVTFTDEDYKKICTFVDSRVLQMGKDEIPIAEMHNIVEGALEAVNPIVAKSYRDYRNYKQDFVHMLDEVYRKSQAIMYIGENILAAFQIVENMQHAKDRTD